MEWNFHACNIFFYILFDWNTRWVGPNKILGQIGLGHRMVRDFVSSPTPILRVLQRLYDFSWRNMIFPLTLKLTSFVVEVWISMGGKRGTKKQGKGDGNPPRRSKVVAEEDMADDIDACMFILIPFPFNHLRSSQYENSSYLSNRKNKKPQTSNARGQYLIIIYWIEAVFLCNFPHSVVSGSWQFVFVFEVHKQRDLIPLDVNELSGDSDDDDELPVFDIQVCLSLSLLCFLFGKGLFHFYCQRVCN